MKKIFLSLIVATAIVAFTGMGWAGGVHGTLVKIDGSFYVVKDDKGKEHRIHFDGSTKMEGEIKEGVHVMVDNQNGHAASIKEMKD